MTVRLIGAHNYENHLTYKPWQFLLWKTKLAARQFEFSDENYIIFQWNLSVFLTLLNFCNLHIFGIV
jgi:hypothetical protein